MGCYQSKNVMINSNQYIENLLSHQELYKTNCKRKSEEYTKIRSSFELEDTNDNKMNSMQIPYQ